MRIILNVFSKDCFSYLSNVRLIIHLIMLVLFNCDRLTVMIVQCFISISFVSQALNCFFKLLVLQFNLLFYTLIVSVVRKRAHLKTLAKRYLTSTYIGSQLYSNPYFKHLLEFLSCQSYKIFDNKTLFCLFFSKITLFRQFLNKQLLPLYYNKVQAESGLHLRLNICQKAKCCFT